MEPRTNPLPAEPDPAAVPPLDGSEPAGPVEVVKPTIPLGGTHHGYARWPGYWRWHEFPRVDP